MISHERLLEVLDYNTETGIFKWKVRTANRIKIGDTLGSKHHSGYLTGYVDKKSYRLHILAVFYTDGVWPTTLVDHRDLNKSNNVRSNLRLATKSENNRNCSIRRDNRSGIKGVSFRNKSGGQWICRLHTNTGRKYLGCFRTKEEAIVVMESAREKYHGEFARHN